jgi:hypothetical protein
VRVLLMLLRAFVAGLAVTTVSFAAYRFGVMGHVHHYAFGSFFLWLLGITVAFTTGALSSFAIDAVRARSAVARWLLGGTALLGWLGLLGLVTVGALPLFPSGGPRSEDAWLRSYAPELRDGARTWVQHHPNALKDIGEPATVSFSPRRGQSLMHDMNDVGVDVELTVTGPKGSGTLRVIGPVASNPSDEPFPACRWTFAGTSTRFGDGPCD